MKEKTSHCISSYFSLTSRLDYHVVWFQRLWIALTSLADGNLCCNTASKVQVHLLLFRYRHVNKYIKSELQFVQSGKVPVTLWHREALLLHQLHLWLWRFGVWHWIPNRETVTIKKMRRIQFESLLKKYFIHKTNYCTSITRPLLPTVPKNNIIFLLIVITFFLH